MPDTPPQSGTKKSGPTTAKTRQILRKLLPEKQRIRVWHEGRGRYRFAGEAAMGLVFRGLIEGKYFGVPNGIRTRVAGLKGRRPRPG
jgi:hypothetical protein